MTDGERTQLTMRHLERAYKASRKTGQVERRDNEVERQILEAMSVLQRINPSVQTNLQFTLNHIARGRK